jgi:thioesterase superfamily protein 4
MAVNKEPDLEHFLSIPWCAKLLNDPVFTITPTISRIRKGTTEDAFIAETLQTPDTIKAWTSFYKTPRSSNTLIEELHALLTLGYRINGHPNIAHGGFLSVIMDEVMGSLLYINVMQRVMSAQKTFTAYLNVTYKKPVPTPGTVLVSVWFREVTGRKCLIEGAVKDADGNVLTRAEGLFVGTQVKL